MNLVIPGAGAIWPSERSVASPRISCASAAGASGGMRVASGDDNGEEEEKGPELREGAKRSRVMRTF